MNCGLLLLLFSGCGTLFISKTVEVPVSSVPPGATITVNGDYVGQTPATIPLDNSESHTVTIAHEQYEDGVCLLNAGIKAGVVIADGIPLAIGGYYALGAFTASSAFTSIIGTDGGVALIGAAVGLVGATPIIVDAATGGWKRLKNPECNVKLSPR